MIYTEGLVSFLTKSESPTLSRATQDPPKQNRIRLGTNQDWRGCRHQQDC